MELVDEHLVEVIGEVLLAPSFEELRPHLRFRDLRDGDGPGLVELAVDDFAVEGDGLLLHVLPFDEPEDLPVLRAVLQRECDVEGVAVRAREHAVL